MIILFRTNEANRNLDYTKFQSELDGYLYRKNNYESKRNYYNALARMLLNQPLYVTNLNDSGKLNTHFNKFHF